MNYTISIKGRPETAETVDAAQLLDACARLSKDGALALDVVAQAETPKVNSTFDGKLVVDAEAKARIEAQHAALAANGVAVDREQQFFATGTRMADVGYATQAARSAEHAAKAPLSEAANALANLVKAEKREDIEVKAGDLAKRIHANGKITFDGLAIGEQAIRGLAARIESPMLGYVLGLRDRIARNVAAAKKAEVEGLTAVAESLKNQSRLDRAEIAAVVAYECKQNPDVALKLRARRAVGDVFAVVSPSYVPADAPEVVADLVSGMPSEARGSFAYDSLSTSWELRASVWTPTPVNEQAVGEAFEGYATFSSRDNGTSRFRGGGGVTLIRCLNASTYTASGVEVARVHRGGVRSDIDAMLRGALSAIDALCKAWGTNRDVVVETPSGVTISEAIPGFWRYCLLDRKSELAGVLPGRSEEHVKGLSAAFHDERRDKSRLVRSDLAQGWTRYIQGQAAPVRREAESAIGDWLVRNRPLGCDLRG